MTEDEHRRLLERCDDKTARRLDAADVPGREARARAGKLPSISPALLRQLAGMSNNSADCRQVNAGGAAESTAYGLSLR